MSDLHRTWERIHLWLEAHCPIVLASLGPPATDDQFREAEEVMGVELPEEVKAVYRIHDGQRAVPISSSWWPGAEFAPGFLYGDEWLSLADMLKSWRMMKELFDAGTFADSKAIPHGPVRAEWWHPKWLPLTEDGSGCMKCLDLAPKSRGHIGQVIYWYHDASERGVLAESLPEWLERFATELERGVYTSVPDQHGPGLIRVDDVYPPLTSEQ